MGPKRKQHPETYTNKKKPADWYVNFCHFTLLSLARSKKKLLSLLRGCKVVNLRHGRSVLADAFGSTRSSKEWAL